MTTLSIEDIETLQLALHVYMIKTHNESLDILILYDKLSDMKSLSVYIE